MVKIKKSEKIFSCYFPMYLYLTLKRKAKEKKKSMASCVREAVSEWINKDYDIIIKENKEVE